MKKVFLIFILAFMLQGCGNMPHNHYFNLKDSVSNYHKIASSINLGDSKSSVMNKFYPLNAKLKPDQQKSPINYNIEGKTFYIHFQRSDFIADGYNTDDEYTPYIFADDKLIEKGWYTLQPQTFGDPSQVYSGTDATRDILGALLAIENSRTGNTGSTYSSSGTSLSSGFTKVCYYDGMSGPSALTVFANSICPLSHSHNISGMTKVCNYPNAMGGPKAITISTMRNCPLNYPG